ncbi:uncharacterized protein LOC120276380 [Dioscorea cayenensis subsp. rotundata]|uniref:Uncharacterized protein LOC120276380 n=1 Tax=Dioscorea cayennensis subsp. rotundata TaxID=55577 RepID=A0AB40CGI2_DIOCR|nr:uncharacterized protein LOC120276380 [Dioscorea cayenensis subsp. rotundata]XP_039139039.1 uncharacterized protein LOC120276380 [Dioscorea cayenensis subsp. rotundata]
MQAEEATTVYAEFNGLDFGEDEYEFANTEFHLDHIQETMSATQNVATNQRVSSESFTGTTRRNQDTNTESSTHRKKAKTKKGSVASTSGNFDDVFISNMQQMSKMCESTSTEFGRMVTCLEALASDVVRKAKDAEKLTDMKAQLHATISAIDGLTAEEVIKAGSIISLDSGKIDYLFSIPDEFKAIYIRCLLAGTL